MRLVGVSGSLRAGSYNSALLRAAQGLTPEGVDLIEGSIRGIPLYDGDVERDQGLPEAVVALKDLIADSDGLLLFTPEYNNGMPGVFKNAIDWLSRPPADIPQVFGERPFALVGASPGGFGTILSQAHWLPVLKTLGVRLWGGQKLLVSRAGRAFDGDGDLADEKMREQLADFLRGFAAFAAE